MNVSEMVKELGSLLSELNRHEDAVDVYRPVLDERVGMLRQSPWRKVHTELSDLRGGLVSALSKNEQREEIGAFLREQLSIWKQLEDTCQDKSGCLLQRTDVHQRLGRWLQDTHEDNEAETHFKLALASVRKAVEMDPANRATWNAWKRVALFHYRSRNWKGAEVEASLAVKLAPDDHNYAGGCWTHRLVTLKKSSGK